MKIILATSNPHKIEEISRIVDGAIEWKMANLEVEEDGKTYEENSMKKACTAFREYGEPAVADDSGLEIDALEGILGVRSARFMEGESYKTKNMKILEMLEEVPDEKRTARFRCVAVYCDGKTYSFEGTIEGKIAREIRGENGFGYDPIFIPDGYTKTMAELDSNLKNEISHRARAFKRLREFLIC